MTAPDTAAFLQLRIAHYAKTDPNAVGAGDALVDLGLQSIDAVLLCGDVEDAFRIELDPATIFEHETMGSFAAEIDRRIAAG
jgi:acyl carrier protein